MNGEEAASPSSARCLERLLNAGFSRLMRFMRISQKALPEGNQLG